MLGLIYPECPVPETSMLNEKEMVIYQNLYSHFYIKKSLDTKQAQKYAMMFILKQKYSHLEYSKHDEQQLYNLIH
jgi:hypothetical protein